MPDMINNVPTVDTRNVSVAPALCLDLDGTVRYSKNGEFINSPVDIAIYDGVREKLLEYRKQGYLIFGISNQGGVAYGMKSPQDEMAEIERTIELLGSPCPFHIIKTCWHHPEGKIHPFNHRSLLRKPDIGMLALCEYEAFNEGYAVDWASSLFVGDRPEDQECALRAGIDFNWAWDFFGRSKPTQ